MLEELAAAVVPDAVSIDAGAAELGSEAPESCEVLDGEDSIEDGDEEDEELLAFLADMIAVATPPPPPQGRTDTADPGSSGEGEARRWRQAVRRKGASREGAHVATNHCRTRPEARRGSDLESSPEPGAHAGADGSERCRGRGPRVRGDDECRAGPCDARKPARPCAPRITSRMRPAERPRLNRPPSRPTYATRAGPKNSAPASRPREPARDPSRRSL